MSTVSSHPPLSRGVVLLLSAITGLAVASNYYAQPLLHTIAAQFGLGQATAGLLVTTAQLGYALGLFALVPLGDLLEKRALIAALALCAALGLAVCGLAPASPWLFAGTAWTGLCVVLAQILVPFAATLADPAERGKVVGTMMSGLLLGILLARTAAGALAPLGGWRTIYWVAAAAMALAALVLWRVLPVHREHAGLSYPRLLHSVGQLLLEQPLLRHRALLGGLIFAVFSVLWTSLAFLLASPAYGYGEAVIGLFGLVGAAGALAASIAGRLVDRGHGRRATLAGLALLLASWALVWWGAHGLVALLLGIVLLDLAVQGVHVTNMALVFQLHAAARNRLTAAYMTCYFIGGALGSLGSGLAYAHGGWNGVCLLGAALSALALLAALRRQDRSGAVGHA